MNMGKIVGNVICNDLQLIDQIIPNHKLMLDPLNFFLFYEYVC